MVPKISNIFVTSFRVQIYTFFLQNDYRGNKKLNLFFLILSISFNIGKFLLEFITARGSFAGVLVPIIAVTPFGELRFPFQLKIFAVSAEIDCRDVKFWR